MDIADIINELKTLYDDQLGFPDCRAPGLTEANVERWSASFGQSRSTLYDQIALHLACGFHSSELTYSFCDIVMVDLSGVITSANESNPDLFWEIYLAFDEGEYYHGDKRDEDPVEVYTRPMIARIVGSAQSASSLVPSL